MLADHKKRILLIITNRYAATNIIHSGLIKPLAEEFEVFIISDLISENEISEINQHFDIQVQNIGIPIPGETAFGRILRRLEKLIFFYHFKIETQMVKNRQSGYWYNALIQKFLDITSFFNLNGRVLKLLRSEIINSGSANSTLSQLNDYHFDGVISSSPLDIRENMIVNYLSKRSVSSLATIISWDNLTSKGIINADHDEVLVWNQFMADEFKQFYSIFPDSVKNISVTGIPRFDIYFKDYSEDFSNENFRARYQFRETDKVILFATSALVHFPDQADIAKHLLEYASTRNNVKILIRCHFGDNPGLYKDLSDENNLQIWSQESKSESEKMPDLEILDSLAQMLRFSDVCVNVASTIRLETAICNKSGISIAYDGDSTLPFHQSVKRLYSYSHQIPLNKTRIDKMVFSKESLFKSLDEILFETQAIDYTDEVLPFIHHSGPYAVSTTMMCIREWLN